MDVRCARCGTEMACAPEMDGECWCLAEPVIARVPDVEGCMCRAWLAAETARQTASAAQTPSNLHS